MASGTFQSKKNRVELNEPVARKSQKVATDFHYCPLLAVTRSLLIILPQNHEKETALHCAAQYGHSDVVSVLLHELTDPTMRNSRQETPLDLAALYGRLEVSPLLNLKASQHHPKALTGTAGEGGEPFCFDLDKFTAWQVTGPSW